MGLQKRAKMSGTLIPAGGGDPISLHKPVLIIGRRPSCDIQLDFPNVSSRHCELAYISGYWRLRDLQSRNGVKVNGVRVEEKIVKPGDSIAFGTHTFKIKYTANSKFETVEEKVPTAVSQREKAGSGAGEETRQRGIVRPPRVEPSQQVAPSNRGEPSRTVEPAKRVEPASRVVPSNKVEPANRVEPAKRVEAPQRVESPKGSPGDMDDDEASIVIGLTSPAPILKGTGSGVRPPTNQDTSSNDSRMARTIIEGYGAPVPADATRHEVGTLIGKYVIKELLGQGTMGVVYRGFDPMVERDVALKVLPPSLSADSTALQRFMSEARAVGKLVHPNATALYEIGQVDGTYFLAMEFVAGGSIASLMLNGKRLSPEVATRYLSEICFGLSAAHEVGLVHRDIKPENLLRTTSDHVKITDFGLAKVSDAMSVATLSLTNPGSLIGTPLYMSPEQFSGAKVDGRTDLYSAGATYYHMLTGTAPYAESKSLMHLMYAHCHRPVPDPRAVVPEIPEGCAQIVMRAMAKSPEERYATASDMALAATSLQASLVSGPVAG